MPYQFYDGTPFDGFVLSGGNAQNEGLSPFADYGFRDGMWEDLEEVFPSDPKIGDTYTMIIHGGSGSYQSWYEFDGNEWIETGTTVPWQMRT